MTPKPPHKTTVRLSDENKAWVDRQVEQHGSTLNGLVNIAVAMLRERKEEARPGSGPEVRTI